MAEQSGKTELIGGPEKREIHIHEYDDRWLTKYAEHAGIIRTALNERLLRIEHIGSTSVPGLAAKPIIDIDIVVEDSSEESAYLPALAAAGYQLRVREPSWHEHRMVRTPERDVHVHIFSPQAPELERHLVFRDYLKKNPEARRLYEATKRHLASQSWEDMNDYADAKSEVVESILASALQD